MRKYIAMLTSLLVILFVSLNSCTKEGPQGPEGPQGEVGPQGAVGLQGDPGIIGNGETEVFLSSNWQDVEFIKSDDNNWIGIIEVPGITEKIVNEGIVEVFGKDSDENIQELNFFKGVAEKIEGDDYLTQKIEIGKITISGSFDASNWSFRYSILIGGERL